MPNIRILYVASGNKAYASGDVFTTENLSAAGFSPTDLVSRGDAEETEDEATAEFPISESSAAEGTTVEAPSK